MSYVIINQNDYDNLINAVQRLILNSDRSITLTQAALELGITRQAVYNQVKSGKIKSYKVKGSKQLYISAQDLDRVKRERELRKA